jgi:hypothetical protein
MWNLVVMDGSSAVFKVVLNSKMSQDIPHEDCEDYKFVFTQDKEEGMCGHGVL